VRNPPPRCRYCEQRHDPDRMCAPARRILDAMVERGMSFNMPTIEFPEPLPANELGLGLGPADALVVQLVVQAITADNSRSGSTRGTPTTWPGCAPSSTTHPTWPSARRPREGPCSEPHQRPDRPAPHPRR
jgi:hypothetical protein